MNKNRSIGTGKFLFAGMLLVVASALIILAPKSAVNVDEMLHYPHAKDVVNWYFTGGEDQSCLHTPQTNLKYYGQSVDNFTALFNRVFAIEDEFLVRHYTGAFFFLLLLVFTGLLAREVTGLWLVAAITVLALALMPRLAGQAFGNLKDIPFATGYVAGLLMIIRFLKEFPHPRWKTALLLGVAIAFTVSVRAGGFILFAYLGLVFLVYFALRPFYLMQIVSTKPVFVRLLGQGAAILVVGYFTGLLFWPYALQNVLVNPFESLQVMEHYKVSIRQVFEGELMWSTQLPWYYLPKWLMISSPLFVLAGFTVYLCFFTFEGFFSKRTGRQLLLEGFVLFAFAFPLVYVTAIGSNLYSGIRQMLFILPPVIMLSVWGIYKLLVLLSQKNKIVFYAFACMFSVILLWPLKHQAATFPVDYVYFNRLFGGNKKAWGNYEYDYYFHGIKEAVDFFEEMNVEEKITVAMNCNLSNYFDGNPGIDYQYTRYLERSSVDWDYGIFGLNYLDPVLLKDNKWKPAGEIKTFYHLGNPVAVLVRRKDKSDFYGISEIKNGNLHQGASILEGALQDQKNNVWLLVNMAKAKLGVGEKEAFLYYLGEGKKIHPAFEPLLLLEASSLYKENNYIEAHDKLLELFRVNPRYLPAMELYEHVLSELEK
jgi:hypothetical protein